MRPGDAGVSVIKPLWGPLGSLPLTLPYAVIGKKSATAKTSYVTNPHPTYPDRFITVGTPEVSHIEACHFKGKVLSHGGPDRDEHATQNSGESTEYQHKPEWVGAISLPARGRSPRGWPSQQSVKAYTVVYCDVHILKPGATLHVYILDLRHLGSAVFAANRTMRIGIWSQARSGPGLSKI